MQNIKNGKSLVDVLLEKVSFAQFIRFYKNYFCLFLGVEKRDTALFAFYLLNREIKSL